MFRPEAAPEILPGLDPGQRPSPSFPTGTGTVYSAAAAPVGMSDIPSVCIGGQSEECWSMLGGSVQHSRVDNGVISIEMEVVLGRS